MAIIDSVLENVDRGLQGQNQGLSMGFNRLVQYVPNVQQGNIYVIGGQTGSGKTAFALSSFMYNPYEDWLARKEKEPDLSLKIMLWSMEMSRDIVVTKAVCREIFKRHRLLVDVNYVLSRGKSRISQEIYDLVKKYRDYFAEMEDVISIFPAENPTGINNVIKNYVLANGKEVHGNLEVMQNGKLETWHPFERYIPNKNQYVIVIIDHVSLLKTEQRFTVKQNIDKLTEYMSELTLKYGITPVLIQQLNRNIEDVDRMKQNSIEVQLSDFRDSSDTTHAAHVVLGLNYPWRWEIAKYRGYDTKMLGDRFRSLKVLKTRDGVADIIIGLGFLGEIGVFMELPKPDQLTPNVYKSIVEQKKYNDQSLN